MMSELVDQNEIEELVGTARHARVHFGRIDTVAGRIYILHSYRCLAEEPDLRLCPFSAALDRGLRDSEWRGFMDRPVPLQIDAVTERLVPLRAGAE